MTAFSLLTLAVAATVAAQDKPDFSGRWGLVSADRMGADVAISLAVRQPITRTNRLGVPIKPAFLELIVERAFGAEVRTERFQIGISGGIVGGGGFESRSSIGWDGDRLVVATSTGRRAEPLTEHQEIWELDPAGMLVITTIDREAAGASKSNKLTYRPN